MDTRSRGEASKMKRQPVITGLGIVSPIGIGVQPFWESALAGRSGTGPPQLFDSSKLPPDCHVVGEVSDFEAREWMPGTSARMAGRFSQFAAAAAKQAVSDCGLKQADILPDLIKVSIGTSMSGLVDVQQPSFAAFLRGEDVWPWACLEFPSHAATSHVAIMNHASGQSTTFATACAAGLDAVNWAANQVARGDATAAIAGGTETPLSQYSLMAFHRVGVLSKWTGPPSEASRPFDRLRDGLVLAEGAAIVVVEDEADARARGTHIYARVLGFGSATEGTHLRKVDETGQTVARAFELALRDAGLTISDIDFISAHGNGMRDYDVAETAGIKAVFGRRAWSIPVSSLKSMCGQSLAAGGPMQLVAACLTLRDQLISPTINLTSPDPACDLDYVPHQARKARIRHVLIHSHSLGGSHVAMILGSPNHSP